jgi:prepilin-type processing-associated H-X9-DG protein
MIAGNSPIHDFDGQNVLFGDGHVEFASIPLVGYDNDNIYAYGASNPAGTSEGIVGPPAHINDSVLLPVSKGARRFVPPPPPFDWSRAVFGVLIFGTIVGGYFLVRAPRRRKIAVSSPG